MASKDRSNDRAIRAPDVMDITGMSRPLIYKEIRAGRFPKGFKLTKKCRAWWESDIRANIEARARGEISYEEAEDFPCDSDGESSDEEEEEAEEQDEEKD